MIHFCELRFSFSLVIFWLDFMESFHSFGKVACVQMENEVACSYNSSHMQILDL